MKNKRQLLVIKEAKITISGITKRYGLRLKLAIDNQDELSFYHTMWFGNHLTYQQDPANKSALIWFVTKDYLKQMNLSSDAYEKLNEIINHSFYGILGVSEHGIYLRQISEDQTNEI